MPSSQRILVIEDEPSIADNITFALSTEGFQPQWCHTAEESIKALRSGTRFALAIIDVGLPDINGFELAKKIQQEFEIPFIFLTARAGEVDRVVGLELGADDYVVKPFSPRELMARVRAVLRRANRSHDAKNETVTRHAGAFELDEGRYRITYHGVPIELSRYEFRLLTVFLKSPGRVYTREHLMQLVWEEPEMSLERTVDTHVKTIRQKLKTIRPDEEPIVTHRGVGYSLKEPE